ncbi:MAG: hypothetical protein ACOY58_03685, partial [Candidatus Micrarchaeota archaeon]
MVKNTSLKFRIVLPVVLLSAIEILSLPSCSEDRVRFIGVDDAVWNFDFSKDGRHLFLVSGWYAVDPPGGNRAYPPNNIISAYSVQTGELRLKSTKDDGEALHVFSCTDPDVFVTSESMHCVDSACGCCDTLAYRRLSTASKIGELKATGYWSMAQTAKSNDIYR